MIPYSFWQCSKKIHSLPQSGIYGYSYDCHPLYYIDLGSSNATTCYVLTAGIHGREYVNSFVLTKLADYYASHEELLIEKSIRLIILPMLNPDGILVSQFGPFGLDSIDLQNGVKQMLKHSPVPYHKWKANARGVDLNRNFPIGFHPAGKPGYKLHAGESAGSEKETDFVIQFMKQIKKPTAVIHLHSKGKVIYWDYKVNSNLKRSIARLMNRARTETGYKPCFETADTKANGGFGDYCAYVLQVPTITLESGFLYCPVPHWQYKSIYNTTFRFINSIILSPLPSPLENAVAEPAEAPICKA